MVELCKFSYGCYFKCEILINVIVIGSSAYVLCVRIFVPSGSAELLSDIILCTMYSSS